MNDDIESILYIIIKHIHVHIFLCVCRQMIAIVCFRKFLVRTAKIAPQVAAVGKDWLGGHCAAYLMFCDSETSDQFSLFTAWNFEGVFRESVHHFSLIDRNFREDHDFLLLIVTDEECDRLIRTCRACAIAKITYNLRDTLLYNVPFREPIDIPLFHVTTLNDTQAVILILRESLDADNAVFSAVKSLHSRLTLSQTLFEHLRPLTLDFNAPISGDPCGVTAFSLWDPLTH